MEGSCSLGMDLGAIEEVTGALSEKDLWGKLVEGVGIDSTVLVF